jgi:MtaA/CmuA family methyltransferase
MMNGKEILLTAIQNQKTSRPAWVPFVGVHGGKIIDVNATDYLQSPDLIFQGLMKAFELYNPDGLPIVFDLQVEAEILGCQLHWADEVPPSVTSHPLIEKSLGDLPDFNFDAGRFPLIKSVTKRIKKKIGDQTALYGLITGPFTLALHLMGSNIFLEMLMEPEKVKEILEFCTSIAQKTALFYIENGADVIAIVDPMTSQISPQHFAEFVSPYLNAVCDTIDENGAFSSLFVCGDATKNLDVMFQTKCHNLSIDENISMSEVKKLASVYNKSFGGNLKLTSMLLLGNPEDVKKHTVDTIDLAGETGFILAPGCDLPYACPVENIIPIAELVHNNYQRDIVRATASISSDELYEDIQLPDYKNNKHIIVEVVTLDSISCAPCQYMLEAAKQATEKYGDQVEVREHKIKTRDGIGHMTKLKVTSIPSICIDGEPFFNSIIPDSKKLAEIYGQKLEKKSLRT